MPGTCPVGCRYDYSKRPAHKHHHCSLKAKMLRKRKAIESQIEMIEIESPNKQCIENKQRNVLHIAERHYPLAYIQHNSLHFLKKRKHPHQIVHKHQHADNTEQGDIKPGRCQQMHQRRNFCTRFLKETEKHRHLSQKGKSRNQKNTQGVHQPLGDHSSQRFGKRYIIILSQNTATRHFTHTRQYQIGSIGNENGVHAIAPFRISPQRFQRLSPAPPAKHMAHYAKKQ